MHLAKLFNQVQAHERDRAAYLLLEASNRALRCGFPRVARALFEAARKV